MKIGSVRCEEWCDRYRGTDSCALRACSNCSKCLGSTAKLPTINTQNYKPFRLDKMGPPLSMYNSRKRKKLSKPLGTARKVNNVSRGSFRKKPPRTKTIGKWVSRSIGLGLGIGCGLFFALKS